MATPEWVLVTAPTFCMRCGQAATTTWRWYVDATATRSYCEPCVEQLLTEDGAEA
jgi:hypothetical protein